jgi:hypothetical protein
LGSPQPITSLTLRGLIAARSRSTLVTAIKSWA